MDKGRDGFFVSGDKGSLEGDGNASRSYFSSRPALILLLSGAMIAVLSWSALALALRGRQTYHDGPPTRLRKAFTEFPADFLEGYTLRHGALEPEIESRVGSHATLKLTGYNEEGWVDIYTSYFGYASTPLEHEPHVCYAAQGWTPLRIQMEIDVAGLGGKIPVNVYFFRKDVERVLVMNNYNINGQYFNDRTPTKFMDAGPGGFYAQTRVTVPIRGDDLTEENVSEHPDFLRAAAVMRETLPLVEEYLPAVKDEAAE